MQRDLVLRWLEQLRLLIARVVRGERDAGTELAEMEVDRALGQLLGGAGGLVDRLDAPSAAALLGDPYRTFGYAEALALKSALVKARGGPAAEVAGLVARSLALAREAVRRCPDPPPEWSEWLAAAEGDVAQPPS